MAKNVIDKIEFETWLIDNGSNQTFEITRNGGINAFEDNGNTAVGVVLDDAVTGAHLIIDGDVSAFGGDSVGLYVDGDDARIDIGSTASIRAKYGVYAGSVDSTVRNNGDISALEKGIIADGAKSIVNGGSIFADIGIENQTNGDLRLTNIGTIAGASQAIVDLGGDMLLVNKGQLVGDIDLGGGDDTFVNKGGTAVGMITGGEGDDTFRMDRDTIFVYENASEGTDTIITTGNFESHEMGEIENFQITGRKNLSLEANGLSNFISGNSGNNFIEGMGGGDVITGGKGRDTLDGGDDTDVFNFGKGHGKDVIIGFDDGDDLIQLDGSTGISGVGDLVITGTQAGMLIKYGNGDTILLKDVHGITLNDDDFLI